MAEMEGRDGLSAEVILDMITKAGGVVVMPHPGEKQSNKPPMYAHGKAEQALNKYAEYVSGVEVYSSKHQDFNRFTSMVETLNNTNPVYRKSPLIATVGSDAHDQDGVLIGRGDTRSFNEGNLMVDIDSDKTINGLRALLSGKASSAGTILMDNLIQLAAQGRYDFKTGTTNIAEIMDRFAELSSSEIDVARKEFIDVLEDNSANIFVREMAAYSLRLFADESAIDSLKKVSDMPNSTDTAKAPVGLPEPIQGMNLAEICDYSLEYMLATELLRVAPDVISEEAQAVIVYSDALDDSKALQELLSSVEKGQRRYYLVNKSDMNNRQLLEMLSKSGISADVFDHVFRETDPDMAVNKIMPVLAHVGISQVRVFALSKEDKAAWNRQRLVDVLLVILKSKEFDIITPDERNRQMYEEDINRNQVLIQA